MTTNSDTSTDECTIEIHEDTVFRALQKMFPEISENAQVSMVLNEMPTHRNVTSWKKSENETELVMTGSSLFKIEWTVTKNSDPE